MARSIFLADGWRVNLAWLSLGGFTVNGLWSLVLLWEATPPRQTLRLLSEVLHFVMVGVLAWNLTQRRRPIVEIANGVVRYGSPYSVSARTTVELRDVASVRLNGALLEFAKRSGKADCLWLGDLSVQSREAVRSAVEDGIRAFE